MNAHYKLYTTDYKDMCVCMYLIIIACMHAGMTV